MRFQVSLHPHQPFKELTVLNLFTLLLGYSVTWMFMTSITSYGTGFHKSLCKKTFPLGSDSFTINHKMSQVERDPNDLLALHMTTPRIMPFTWEHFISYLRMLPAMQKNFSVGVESMENPMKNTLWKSRLFESGRLITPNTIMSTAIPCASLNLSQSIGGPLRNVPASLLYSYRKRKDHFHLRLQPTQPCWNQWHDLPSEVINVTLQL